MNALLARVGSAPVAGVAYAALLVTWLCRYVGKFSDAIYKRLDLPITWSNVTLLWAVQSRRVVSKKRLYVISNFPLDIQSFNF